MSRGSWNPWAGLQEQVYRDMKATIFGHQISRGEFFRQPKRPKFDNDETKERSYRQKIRAIEEEERLDRLESWKQKEAEIHAANVKRRNDPNRYRGTLGLHKRPSPPRAGNTDTPAQPTRQVTPPSTKLSQAKTAPVPPRAPSKPAQQGVFSATMASLGMDPLATSNSSTSSSEAPSRTTQKRSKPVGIPRPRKSGNGQQRAPKGLKRAHDESSPTSEIRPSKGLKRAHDQQSPASEVQPTKARPSPPQRPMPTEGTARKMAKASAMAAATTKTPAKAPTSTQTAAETTLATKVASSEPGETRTTVPKRVTKKMTLHEYTAKRLGKTS